MVIHGLLANTELYDDSSRVYILQSLSKVADAIDRINKKADKEYFIKVAGTGTLRPVDRVVDL